MELTMSLPTPEDAEHTRGFIKKAGGNATWDRLAEYLEKQLSGREKFVINRSFDVPLHVMYDLWTRPEHFSKWLPPAAFQMEFKRADIRPGGSAFYHMYDGQGLQMYGRVEYQHLDPGGSIIYRQQFCDERERLSRHPFVPTWPQTILTTVVLTEEAPDQTRVTVFWEPFGEPTPEELGTFVDGRKDMTLGWTGSFDKLEEYCSDG